MRRLDMKQAWEQMFCFGQVRSSSSFACEFAAQMFMVVKARENRPKPVSQRSFTGTSGCQLLKLLHSCQDLEYNLSNTDCFKTYRKPTSCICLGWRDPCPYIKLGQFNESCRADQGPHNPKTPKAIAHASCESQSKLDVWK